ncbi:unnamed protein product [Amoebophrya sp. A25]|nr:unnamed protein product [Amoebophrya sp. A25]|eukprot:GSA25T00006799001.1
MLFQHLWNHLHLSGGHDEDLYDVYDYISDHSHSLSIPTTTRKTSAGTSAPIGGARATAFVVEDKGARWKEVGKGFTNSFDNLFNQVRKDVQEYRENLPDATEKERAAEARSSFKQSASAFAEKWKGLKDFLNTFTDKHRKLQQIVSQINEGLQSLGGGSTAAED